jgi:hypothetical protein
MFNRKVVFTARCVGVLALVVAASAHGWGDSRKTYLTFSGPVALPGVTLGAGTYIFERAEPTAANLVRVSSRDRAIVFLTVPTRQTERPEGLPYDRTVIFGEALAGTAPPIKAWFPVGERTGHTFVYGSSGH